MTVTYKTIAEHSIDDLAELRAAELQHLQADASAAVIKAKALKDYLDRAIHFKYESRVKKLRDTLEKESGVVNFEDDNLQVTAELPKKVIWNQEKLADIAQRIQKNGDDPSEYIDITYKVQERKYTAWPAHLRDAFAPARTLKTGKQTFSFTAKKGALA